MMKRIRNKEKEKTIINPWQWTKLEVTGDNS